MKIKRYSTIKIKGNGTETGLSFSSMKPRHTYVHISKKGLSKLSPFALVSN